MSNFDIPANVVPFPGTTPVHVPTVYGCACGSTLFRAYADGDLQCSECFGVLLEVCVAEKPKGAA